ncbi:MAG: hypothetical protein SVW77_01175 [Candidatus Nanohaloarchaea archaeon]|nr:hypothetical protein [Candidatus Nanohaloarchaea archaeon]
MAGEVDAAAVALAGGVTWACAVLLAGLGSMVVPGWQTAVGWLGQFYVGYAPTVTGSIVGAVWGFFDVAIGLYVFFRLYNYFHSRL